MCRNVSQLVHEKRVIWRQFYARSHDLAFLFSFTQLGVCYTIEMIFTSSACGLRNMLTGEFAEDGGKLDFRTPDWHDRAGGGN